MHAFGAFIRLSRLKFLIGGFLGGALGSCVAAYERGSFDWGTYALAQITITSAHLMTQYANEYFDRESDKLTVRTPFSGGSGVLVDGSLAPSVALVAALWCLAINLCGVTALGLSGHIVAAMLGAACAGLAWAYSAPPLRFLGCGLGELDGAVVVAILVPLCAYAAQTGNVDVRALASTLPGAAAMFVMMLCVEIPDRVADGRTGKRNLVVRLGTKATASLGFAVLAAGVAAIGLARGFGAPTPFCGWELAAIVPMAPLAVTMARLARGDAVVHATIAGRGVVYYVCVCTLGAIGYAQATRW